MGALNMQYRKMQDHIARAENVHFINCRFHRHKARNKDATEFGKYTHIRAWECGSNCSMGK